MAKVKIIDYTREVLSDFLKENGLELYDCEYVKEGRDRFLRVYIDREQTGDEERYVGTDDCELVSRYLSDRLDEDDPVEENYYLEVSSPGMDRKLTRPEHFCRYTGRQVDVKLYKALDGKKQFSCELAGFDGSRIRVITEEGKEMNLDPNQIAKVSLSVVF